MSEGAKKLKEGGETDTGFATATPKSLPLQPPAQDILTVDSSRRQTILPPLPERNQSGFHRRRELTVSEKIALNTFRRALERGNHSNKELDNIVKMIVVQIDTFSELPHCIQPTVLEKTMRIFRKKELINENNEEDAWFEWLKVPSISEIEQKIVYAVGKGERKRVKKQLQDLIREDQNGQAKKIKHKMKIWLEKHQDLESIIEIEKAYFKALAQKASETEEEEEGTIDSQFPEPKPSSKQIKARKSTRGEEPNRS